MKKSFATFLILNFAISNFMTLNFITPKSFAINSVSDELVNSLDKNLKVEKQQPPKIEDDFAIKTLNPNLKVEKYSPKTYSDDDLELCVNTHVYAKGDKEQKFNFESLDDKIIKISPKKYYTTRTNLREGDLIEFALTEDVKIKNKLYKKDTPVIARVENVSKNSSGGVPADLVLDNFVLASNIMLNGSIEKQGANRSLWVNPCFVSTSWFFGLGLLFLPIRGGHVKLKPTQIYELNYSE